MFKKSSTTHTKDTGFTLVELLLVVTLLGVMAGALTSVINYSQHRKNANDAIIRVNLGKLVTGIEAYRSVEGKYPSDPNGDGNPSDDAYLANYLRSGWLNNEPVGAVYSYYVSGGRNEVGVMASLNSGMKIKYTTEWGQARECKATTIVSDLGCL